jgi:hypothetical protein
MIERGVDIVSKILFDFRIGREGANDWFGQWDGGLFAFLLE